MAVVAKAGRRARLGWLGAVVAMAAVVAGCSEHRAAIDVSLAGAPAIAPLVVHGNCLAGWTLSATLVVRNRGEADATISFLGFQVEDPSGRVVAQETLDATALADRYGQPALRSSPGESRELVVGTRVEGPMSALVLSGDLHARDAKGTIRTPFRIHAAPVNAPPPAPGAGGACDGG